MTNNPPEPEPNDVSTDTGPDANPGGTSTVNDDAVAATTRICTPPTHTWFSTGTVENPDPVTTTVSPGRARSGATPETDGAFASGENDPAH